MNVGFVGTGNMGRPMLGQVVQAGHEVCFFARRPEIAAAVAALGASRQPTIAAVGAAADVVVVCVFSDEQVREVCLGDDGLLAAMRPGSVLVLHTTCRPATPRALSEKAPGIEVLDAAFSGGPSDAASASITLLVGGGEQGLERARPVLSCYAGNIFHVGALGDGQRIKLVNNALFGAGMRLAVEAERLLAALGADPVKAFEAIACCSGNSYAVRISRAAGSAAAASQAAGRYIEKDVATARQFARECGTSLGLLDQVAAGNQGPAATPAEEAGKATAETTGETTSG
jgi:3-hydroxyisobutyrate dehydrogenase-like beta-hydroxyacid dehydrogenase